MLLSTRSPRERLPNCYCALQHESARDSNNPSETVTPPRAFHTGLNDVGSGSSSDEGIEVASPEEWAAALCARNARRAAAGEQGAAAARGADEEEAAAAAGAARAEGEAAAAAEAARAEVEAAAAAEAARAEVEAAPAAQARIREITDEDWDAALVCPITPALLFAACAFYLRGRLLAVRSHAAARVCRSRWKSRQKSALPFFFPFLFD